MKNVTTDIIIIEKSIRQTVQYYIINILANSVYSEELNNYTYNQLFELLFYYIALQLRLEFGHIIISSVHKIILSYNHNH